MDNIIQDVAVYLRKSRGDAESDLEKHRLELNELCQKMDIKNSEEYAEIGNSDSIQDRPEFTKLLQNVKQGLYDAVVVMDIDRLGRGDDEDWGKIEKILRENEVAVITPEKIYDWEDENDEFQIDVKKFIARMEYKQITKRFRRGKITGAKQGKWTNGRPPFPYYYNKEKQMLEVDEEKKKVYRFMIEKALEGFSAEEISWELNRLGHKSPGGKKYWSNVAVYRLLGDQTHLGKIVIGKQKGSGHINKKTKPLKILSEKDWQIYDGLHVPLKTQQEHEKILELRRKRKIIPCRARQGEYVLSGLVYCGKCGYSMQITRNGKTEVEYLKICQHSDPFGNRCGNRGVNSQIIIDTIFQELGKYEKQIQNETYDVGKEVVIFREAIAQKEKSLKKEQKAIDILQEQREDGEITKERFLERKEIRESNIQKLKQEIQELERRCALRENASNLQRLITIENFRKKWIKSNDKNRLLRKIIDRIDYIRDGDDISTKVYFR